MPYTINGKCIGCTVCAKKCPVPCIWSAEFGRLAKTKEMHYIDPRACIDCGVCASYCPVDCILNGKGVVERKIDRKLRPVAVVEEENCTGCEWCADACPFDCIGMVAREGEFFRVARVVRPKDCVGCKLCEEVCVQKGAIFVARPDGSPTGLGVGVRPTYLAPDRPEVAAK